MAEVNFKEILKSSGMPVDEKTVANTLYQEVNRQGIITNTSDMSPFWRLLQLLIIKPYMWLVDTLISKVLCNLFLITSKGAFVDLFATAVNITRKPAASAQGVVRFVKTSKQEAITVEAGTLIQTERINGIIYQLKTTEKTLINAGTESAFISVIATDTGRAYNLAPGYYQILPREIKGIDSVCNEEDWLTRPGDDLESDEQLKIRCQNQFNLAGNYHTDAVYKSMIASRSGLSIDRIYFKHEAPRGPGTANAYLLLDTGVISQPYVDTVNKYITGQGHHGHGDDMLCYPLPHTTHDLDVILYVKNAANLTRRERDDLEHNSADLIRCAFRENSNYQVEKTLPWSRFSFSRLGQELHDTFPLIDSVVFSLDDIVSELTIPRLGNFTIKTENATGDMIEQ